MFHVASTLTHVVDSVSGSVSELVMMSLSGLNPSDTNWHPIFILVRIRATAMEIIVHNQQNRVIW